MEIRKVFEFAAAHRLPNVPSGHKCGRMHGHTYRVHVVLTGKRDPEMGWVLDFGDVKAAFQRLVDQWLDHRTLNDIPGLYNPTAENLCWFLFDALSPTLQQLARIEVWETPTSMAALNLSEYIWRTAALEGEPNTPDKVGAA